MVTHKAPDAVQTRGIENVIFTVRLKKGIKKNFIVCHLTTGNNVNYTNRSYDDKLTKKIRSNPEL